MLPCPTCAATIEDQALRAQPDRSAPEGRADRHLRPGSADFGSATIAPHATWTAQATATVRHPQLWAPGHPYLYTRDVDASDAKRPQARAATSPTAASARSRSPPTVASTLNGRLLDLRGVNLHEQAPAYGAALDPAQMQRLIGWVQELGATLIRAHYPLNPEIEEMADRTGSCCGQRSPSTRSQSRFLSQPGWLTYAHAVLTNNILTNQNHPSVLLWSIANELPTPRRPHAEATLHRRAPSRSPTSSTRPGRSAWRSPTGPGVACQAAYAPLDVIGFNDYFGWFDAGGGAHRRPRRAGPFLDYLHACYPTQGVCSSASSGSRPTANGPVEERGTYEFQADPAAFHLGVFASKPWLSGAIWFALQDFAARPGWTGGDPAGTRRTCRRAWSTCRARLKPVFSGRLARSTTGPCRSRPIVRRRHSRRRQSRLRLAAPRAGSRRACTSLSRGVLRRRDCLRRTPLYERHVAAGAKLVPFAGWEMPVQYAGISEEHLAVRHGVGVFDVSHMGQVETRGPAGGSSSSSGCSPTTCAGSPRAAPSTACCAARTAACSTTSSPTGSPSAHFLTVTNAANHEKDLAWLQSHAASSTSTCSTATPSFAMLAVQGPRARELVRGARATGTLPSRLHCCERTRRRRADARVRHRLHRRGRRRAAARPRRRAGGLGRAPRRRRDARPGSGARDTLRLEACFHLYGNDLSEDRGPDRGRPRLVLQGGDRLHRRRGGRGRAPQRDPPRSSSRS